MYSLMVAILIKGSTLMSFICKFSVYNYYFCTKFGKEDLTCLLCYNFTENGRVFITLTFFTCLPLQTIA